MTIVRGPALAGALFVLLVDAAGSFVSEQYRVPYKNLEVVPYLACAVTGFAAMRRSRSFRSAVATSSLVGLIHATLGWVIAWQIGAARFIARDISGAEMAGTVVLTVVLAAIAGILGATIARTRRST